MTNRKGPWRGVDGIRWAAYALNPIDFGWENLSTAEETLKVIRAAEDDARREAESSYLPYYPGDLGYSSDQFSRELASALETACFIAEDNELRHEPAVLWLPSEHKFSYAFVFKMENNGTTIVVSPFELPWLDKCSMTEELIKNRSGGLQGSYRQVKWAKAIVEEACATYMRIAEEIPTLVMPLTALCRVLRGKTDSGWIIGIRQKYGISTHKLDGKTHILRAAADDHPLLGVGANLSDEEREELSPLISALRPAKTPWSDGPHEASSGAEVEIHCIGSCSPSTKRGQYEVLLTHASSRKYMTSQLANTTINRCIIQGIIDGVRQLGHPCTVRVTSRAPIDLLKNGANSDLIGVLADALTRGGHTYTFTHHTGSVRMLQTLVRSAAK